MSNQIWEVRMGDSINRKAHTNIYNVRAETLLEAVGKAVAMEKAWCDQMTEDEGEDFTPSEPVFVHWLCELSEGPPNGSTVD